MILERNTNLNIEEMSSNSPKYLSEIIAPQKMLPILVSYKSAIKEISARVGIIDEEIQIRTIAMDFWASLEHQLGYKIKASDNTVPRGADLRTELKNCAEEISSISNGRSSFWYVAFVVMKIKARSFL
jgi:hypothetical protein